MISKYLKTPALIFSMVAFCTVFAVAYADDVAGDAANGATPFQFDEAKLAGEGLTVIPPFPPESIISGGDPAPKLSVLFRGDIVFGVFESKTAKFKVSDPWAYDEYVMVLAGELHLYDDATGKTQVFKEGAHVMVPKGFTGTWENIGNPYRETFIIERETFESVWGTE